jgi:cytidyltransferase-like protein
MAVPVSESIAFSIGITIPVAYTIGRFQPPTIGHKSLIERVREAGPDGKAYVFVSSTTTPKDKNPLESREKMPILGHLVEEGVKFVDTAKCKEEGNPCGGAIAAFYYLLDHEKHKAEDIILVVGDDHRDDFGPTAPIWNIKEKKNEDGTTKPAHRFGPGGEVAAGQPLPANNFVLVSSADRDKDLEKKDDANMSGTKARQYVKLGRKEDFYLAVGANDPASKDAANTVYAKIAGSFKKKGGHDYNLRPRVAIATSDDTTDVLLEKGKGPDAEFTYGGGRRRTYRRCRKCGLPKKPETQ